MIILSIPLAGSVVKITVNVYCNIFFKNIASSSTILKKNFFDLMQGTFYVSIHAYRLAYENKLSSAILVDYIKTNMISEIPGLALVFKANSITPSVYQKF